MSTKYPKTPHLPFSPCVNIDDTTLDEKHCRLFLEEDIIITEKLDGGNCQIYQGKVYARTNSTEATHSSFSAVKQLSSPDNYALFGENMFGIHSIEYTKLTDYFYLFSILDVKTKTFISWDEVKSFSENNGLETPPILFEGKFKE